MDTNVKIMIKDGIDKFNKRRFYDSHEIFEDVWINHKLDDRLFIQGLIQLSVAYFHISNQNKNGAIGLFKKCTTKLNLYKKTSSFIINLDEIIDMANKSLLYLESIEDMKYFKWELAPQLLLSDEF